MIKTNTSPGQLHMLVGAQSSPLRARLRTHKVFTVDQIVVVFLPKIPLFLHKNICCGCVLESPRRGDSNTHPQHMFLWRNIKNCHFLLF